MTSKYRKMFEGVVEGITESKTDHRAEARDYEAKARRCKEGTEEYFDAMAKHHYHAGHHLRSQGDEEGARDHFHKSYGFSRKD